MTKFNYKTIPEELRNLKQWGLFHLKYIPEHKKNTKIPLNAYDGTLGKSNDPSTWAEFDTALRALDKFDNADGLAFYFANGYVGLDIDSIESDLQDYFAGSPETLITTFRNFTKKTYMEISQSGKGIHAIFKGKIPGTHRRKGNYEMYESGRFFALTGNTIGSNKIQSLNQTEMKKLYEFLFGKDKIVSIFSFQDQPINDLSVSEIINRMLTSAKGQRDKLFMQGGWEKFYPSQSEADLAFANDLAFWTGKNFQKMDTIFRNSSLMRDKWDEKRGATTYGIATLNKAINNTVNTFTTRDAEAEDVYGFNQASSKKKKTPPRSWDDMGMAQRFLDQLPHRFLYSMTDKMWYAYNGSYWEQDNQGLIEKAADQVINNLKNESLVIQDDADKDKAQKAWQKFIKSERSRSSKVNMINEIKHLVPVLHSQWDKEKMMLNTPSGYIDLTNGTLHDHDYKKMFTQETGVDYTEKVDCPLWIEFLNQTFQNDQELIHFIQKIVGYSLTGSNTEQVMFILFGNGRNGKSVLLNIIKYISGTYAKTMNAETIMQKRNNSSQGPSSDIARLEGARLVISSEANEGDRLDESLIKQMTGGDTLVARYSYGRDFEFDPVFKLWMATNHMPKIYGTDEGIWRRLIIIPFTHTVKKENVDKNLEDKLKAESMGILKWAIDGAMMWQREGLNLPKIIKQASQDYREETDVIEAFISESCVAGNELKVKASELFDAYKKWADETNNWEGMSNTKFGIEISKRFRKARTKNGIFYRGLDLNVNQQFGFNQR
ncbi:DNA primase [Lactobacillus gallinarum]|nr:DNA primase [Lactobacillus gallinarum]